MDKLLLLRLSKTKMHFWQQSGWGFGKCMSIQTQQFGNKRPVKQRNKTENLWCSQRRHFSKHQLTLEFVLQKSAVLERLNPPVNNVSAWELEVYIWHQHWQAANIECSMSSKRGTPARKETELIATKTPSPFTGIFFLLLVPLSDLLHENVISHLLPN